MQKQVVFADMIKITEFPMILGDNPACRSGAPVQLDWAPCSTNERNLEMFEYLRQNERRQSRKSLVISTERRGRILLRMGYSIEEIAEAAMEAEEVKEQRQETLLKEDGWDHQLATIIKTTGKLPGGVVKGVLGTTGGVVSTTGKVIMAGGRVLTKIIPGNKNQHTKKIQVARSA